MTEDKTPKDNPAELNEGDLNEVHGGASGLFTGKRQHKPFSKATPAARRSDKPTEFNLGGDFSP